MKDRRLCFLDMDGVLADFVKGICAVHGRPNPYTDSANFGNFDMDKIWGMPAEEFWIKSLGHDFWYDLEKTPEADEIFDLAMDWFETDNVFILTSPAKDPHCVPGKRAWVEKWFPKLKRKMLFGSCKEALAGSGRVLIDDRDSNLKEFAEFGGDAVAVPRPWNTFHHYRNDAVGYVRGRLKYISLCT